LKKSYSEHNLLQERLMGRFKPRSLFKYLITSRKAISIKIPYYEYLRGRIFINDIKDIYGDEVPHSFDILALICMLYDDFMDQMKRGGEHKLAAMYLLEGKMKLSAKSVQAKRELKALSSHIFSMEEVEIENEDTKDERHAYLEILMKEEEILRGEVLIHDLENYLDGQALSVEDIIVIRYVDFINKIKQEGNTQRAQNSIKSILYRLNNEQ
jgi:hypothetical protein